MVTFESILSTQRLSQSLTQIACFNTALRETRRPSMSLRSEPTRLRDAPLLLDDLMVSIRVYDCYAVTAAHLAHRAVVGVVHEAMRKEGIKHDIELMIRESPPRHRSLPHIICALCIFSVSTHVRDGDVAIPPHLSHIKCCRWCRASEADARCGQGVSR